MIREVNYLSYSYAIYEIALEDNKVSTFNKNAHEFAEMMENNDDIVNYLSADDTLLSFKHKDDLLNKILKGMNPNFINAIKLIAQDKKARFLPRIINSLIKKLNAKEDILEGIIYTTKKISQQQIKRFETKLAKEKNKKIILRNKIDPNIISGFKIVFNDLVIENNIDAQLKDLKQQLLYGGNYGN
ncbi:F0F1 ATP synthase subunit delta [Mycoplasmopsis californica]|uniref:ATP synthase subunit delta n=1 Tax=Mycoplasmopsis equigenitalium TaxID=114883 RepID=A0ABY5J223_9BACT|nr:ATP synthase F1 subunit delta [Mycoplasmopsis equigenitalium]UUD37291.1 ATP synthase F1 subunit delta [Mycoplasmopsis equigenitalium]VEU69399.1 F0F1 ATP synthase subunit delta [Mycoplasmopsis californica]